MNFYNKGQMNFFGSEIDSYITKIEFLNINEISTNTNILQALDNVALNYDSQNLSKFLSLQNELINKFSTIQKNHNNNLQVLIKTREKYLSTSEIVSKKFNDIAGD